MSNEVNNQTTKIRKEKTKELTSYLLHKHYCENDEDALIEHFDEYFSWLGTGEQEYAVGYETVKDIFRKFSAAQQSRPAEYSRSPDAPRDRASRAARSALWWKSS